MGTLFSSLPKNPTFLLCANIYKISRCPQYVFLFPPSWGVSAQRFFLPAASFVPEAESLPLSVIPMRPSLPFPYCPPSRTACSLFGSLALHSECFPHPSGRCFVGSCQSLGQTSHRAPVLCSRNLVCCKSRPTYPQLATSPRFFLIFIISDSAV